MYRLKNITVALKEISEFFFHKKEDAILFQNAFNFLSFSNVCMN